MKKVDFLSQPPSNKLSIFSEERNKTHLGGAILILEIIIMILIAFIYLFDHKTNAHYSIETNTIFETKVGVYDNSNYKDSENFDKETQFNFQILSNYYNTEVSNRFEIVDFTNRDYSPNNLRNKGIKKSPSKLKLAIYYRCYNETICRYYESSIDKDITKDYYKFRIYHPGFIINHHSRYPILDNVGPISYECPFLFNMVTLSIFHWQNIKYEEDNGMWSRLFNRYILGKEPDTFIKGIIDSSSTFPVEIEDDRIVNVHYLKNRLKLVALIEIDNNVHSYLQYRRIPNSIFTTFANIAALISTVNFLLSTFLNFYSRNYDNYSIIRYITSSKGIVLEKNFKQVKELIDFHDKKEEKNDPLINNDNDMVLNKEGDDIENKVNENYYKINFLQFFWNNLYCNCCRKTKEQEIIKLSNEIIGKYLSIDNILYNQMLLENLWKDYKWNNPNLSNIKKNELIINFKNLTQNNYL